ncbi:MAG: phytanoyl-CoA dioxygenase family protein [Nitrosopumilus sp.]|nr:phytanoyl-CoA dioxygenase family protein [Nitrosopumilus sp.]
MSEFDFDHYDKYSNSLKENGFFLFKELLPYELINQINSHVRSIFSMEGDCAGMENPCIEPGVIRLANLADKGRIFSEFYAHPVVLQAISSVLGNFNLVMLNARKTLPRYVGNQRQAYHTDTDINQNKGIPDEKGYFSCTAILFLTDSTIENGATNIIPGSHLSYSLPQDLLSEPTARLSGEITITGKAGDVCVLNGHCWHCGGSNKSANERLTLLAHYLRPDIYRDKCRMQYLSYETKMSMSAYELRLFGYSPFLQTRNKRETLKDK